MSLHVLNDVKSATHGINPWISMNINKDDSRAKEIHSQLYLKQRPASSVKTAGKKKTSIGNQ